MDADAWDERYAASDLIWSATPNQFVAEELSELSPGRAVDVAAGEGRNALWLASLGWQVTALDFSRVALDKGRRIAERQELSGSLEWEHADATVWHAEASYDLAVVAYLQLPAEERRAAHRNAFESLVVGGTFLLVAHDATNLLRGTGGPQDPDFLMTADDVLADLGGLSYDVIRAERVERIVEPGHGGEPQQTALDCLVRVERTG